MGGGLLAARKQWQGLGLRVWVEIHDVCFRQDADNKCQAATADLVGKLRGISRSRRIWC